MTRMKIQEKYIEPVDMALVLAKKRYGGNYICFYVAGSVIYGEAPFETKLVGLERRKDYK